MTTSIRLTTVLLLLGVSTAQAQQPALEELSLQDLLNVEVTSVARKEQTVARTAAAVYVITADDIRRSGATSLPDVLRMAPGFSVSQLNASAWSVTARGFGGLYANKLLVMVDGRSINSTETGGVHWGAQLIPLEQIEQIEVIRGPGGSLWGASAVNGIINIITRNANASQGGRLATQLGTHAPGTFDVSFGSRPGDTVYNVTRGRYVRSGSSTPLAGFADGDRVESFYARTRFDWGQQGVDQFSLSADAQSGDQSQVGGVPIFTAPYRLPSLEQTTFTGRSVVLAWTRAHSSRVETNLQTYYSGGSRASTNDATQWHVADVDLRQRRAVGARHDVVAGLGFRYTTFDFQGGLYRARALTPAQQESSLVTGFVQDEIAVAERLRLTPGVKIERNGNTGIEVQPSLRGIWTPTKSQSVWAAASRSVRTPNRQDRGLHLAIAVLPSPTPLPLVVTVDGNPDFRSEVLKAYEVGYRFQRSRVSVDATTYVTRYQGLLSAVAGAPGPGFELGRPVIRLPITFMNTDGVRGNGAEVAATWILNSRVRVAGSYTLLDVDGDALGGKTANNSPVAPHQWHLRTYVDLPRRVSLTAMYYGVSAFKEVDVDAYNRLDFRTAWTFRELEIAAGVQNLLRREVPEYRDLVSGFEAAPIRRNVFVSLGWRF